MSEQAEAAHDRWTPGAARPDQVAPVINLTSLPVGDLEDDAVIDLHDLEVWYEPQVDLTTGDLTAFEALLRWRHPGQGLIGPERALASADRQGLHLEVLSHVLGRAADQAGAWRRLVDEPPAVAVNVAPQALAYHQVVELVRTALGDARLPATSLRLEITEQGDDRASPSPIVVEELRRLGVQLALDDVGTGASSLERARDLRVDQFKIDRSFVAGIAVDRADRAIVAALISLAAALDLDVVAEGIETAEQLRVLRELGCETGQGYYWQRPVPAESALAIVRRRTPFPHPSER